MKQMGLVFVFFALLSYSAEIENHVPSKKPHLGGDPSEFPITVETEGTLPGSLLKFRAPNEVRGLYCGPGGVVEGSVQLSGFRLWRFAPVPGPHLFNKVGSYVSLSPNGKTAEMHDRIYDLQTHEELTADWQKSLPKNTKVLQYKYSSNGRYVVYSFYANATENGNDGQEDGIAVFDTETRIVKIGPKGFKKPRWVSNDGKFFACESNNGGENKYSIRNLAGELLYPKEDDPALAGASSVSTTPDDKTAAIEVKRGSGERSLRIYALPGWELKNEIILPQNALGMAQISRDGKYIVGQLKEGVEDHSGPSSWSSNYQPVLWDASSGRMVAKPFILRGNEIRFCGDSDKVALIKRVGTGDEVTVEIVPFETVLALGKSQ